MSVPTNLIPTLITGLQEYTGSSTLGYMPYILDGRTYKVQFANIAAVGAVPSSRVIAAGTGLAGGGDLSANRVISIANGGVGFDQLALSGVTQGTYGSGSAIPILTVDSKGRITSATTAPLDVTGFVPTSRTITAGDGLTGGGALTSNVTLAANFSAATPSALGTASAGTAITVSRGDHVHPAVNLSDTSQTQGALPLGRGGTGDALSPVAGAVVYSTGSKFALTNPGIVGQVLVSAGTDEPQWQTILGTGTVTSVSVSTANGFAGFVANPATVPDITLSTTVTGMLKGDGTGMSAATAGVDYVEPGPYTTSGLTMASARLLGRTTASVGAAQEITVGTGLTLSGGSLVNAAPDQTVSLTAGTAISVTGTYPSFTVTNTAPDQVVSLTGAGTTTVTGTYPSFTITSNDSTSGTVTSVNASGGTTGMSFTGGPVTSAGTLTLNGTLAVSNGGTGATDAATALTNLGAYPASNPAGYTTNVGTVTSVSGTGTVSGLSLSGTVTSAGSLTLGGTLAVLPSNFASQTANTVLAAPNGSAGVPTFRSLVAADVPTLNQNTTGTASNVTGIVAVANGGTGASVAGTARTNLGAAASGANTDITSIALTTGTISTSPVNGTDIVNKAYADSIASGINFHQSVRLATAAALPANTYNNGTSGVGATLTANANGALTVDGVAAVVGNRILVKNEATQANNGVYTVTQVGNGSTPYILTRATDFDSSGSGVDQIDAGDFFLVTAGSTLANTSWVQQTPLPITVGTTAIVFSQFAAPVLYSAGTGLSLTGTTFSITNTGVSASTYGSASSVPVIAVNAQGQITSASASSIAIAASQITSGALAIANGGTGATSAATALTNLGAYPASNPSGFTSNTGTVTSVNLTAGTGVSVSGGPITASGSITVTNTAPDQVVSLTGSGATTVTGTYPNFTISSTAGGSGTVTSINVSGGTTGLTTSGGPVTSSGTITLAGTLNVANGGTGATTLSSGYLLKGNGTSAVSASVVYDNGTNVGIGTPSPAYPLQVRRAGGGGSLGISIDGVGATDRTVQYFAVQDNAAGVGSGHAFYYRAPSSTTDVLGFMLDEGGNVGINTTTPAGKFSSNTGASGSYVSVPGNVNSWDATTSLFGAAGSSTGAAVAIGMTAAGGYISALAPSVAWQNLYYQAGTHYWYNGVNQLGVLNTAGDLTAIGSMRAPIFYDSGNTAYYLDAAGNSVFSAFNIGGGEVYFYGSATNAVSIRTGAGGAYRYFTFDASGNFYALNGSVYGQRFYDQDNTAYYVDPNGTSVLNIVTTAGYIQTYAGGVKWDESGTRSWSMYPSGGAMLLNSGDGNGSFNLGASGGVRAPIYYDSNNTGYYVDAASTSVLYQINTGVGINLTGGIALNGSGATLANSIGARLTENYGPLWNCDNSATWHHQVINGSMLCGFTAGGTNWGSGKVVANSDMRATLFYDYSNTAYYIDPNAGSNVLGDFRVNQNGAAGIQLLSTTGTQSLWIRTGYDGAPTPSVSATNVQFQSSGSSAGTFTFWSGNTLALSIGGDSATGAGSLRAPIFYDSTDTAYYWNFASGAQSNIYTFITGLAYYQSQFGSGVYSGAVANAPLQVYSNDGGTAMMSFHRAGAYAINMGLDPDNYLRIGGWSAAANRWVLDGSGNNWVAGSFRAPIFYDSDNTAYYIDAASNSILNTLTLGNRATTNAVFYSGFTLDANTMLTNSTGFTYAVNAPYVGPIARLGHGAYDLFFNAPYSLSGYGLAFRTQNGDTATNNPWRYPAVYDVNVNGGGALYASVYYDQNNTAYYVDPASTSRTNYIWSSTGTYGANSTGTFGGNTSGLTGVSQVLEVRANAAIPLMTWHYENVATRHIGLDANGFLQVYNPSEGGGSVFQANNSLRAPIFYDSNNTGYYVDPNSTSNLLGLTVANIINGFVTGCTFAEDSVNKDDIATRSDSGFYQSSSGTTAEGWPINDGNWQHMISCTHTNDGNYFAMQLGASFFSQGLFYRSVANSGTQAWSRVALYGNGYAAPLYANVYYDADNTTYYLDPSTTGTSLNVAGAIVAGGNVTAYSDIRIKANIETIPSALDKLDQIRGVTYTRTDLEDKEQRYAGVIAQEIEAVLPEAVRDLGDIKAVDYNATIALLIQAVKELRDEVEALRK